MADDVRKNKKTGHGGHHCCQIYWRHIDRLRNLITGLSGYLASACGITRSDPPPRALLLRTSDVNIESLAEVWCPGEETALL
jgi:hypothetical protein